MNCVWQVTKEEFVLAGLMSSTHLYRDRLKAAFEHLDLASGAEDGVVQRGELVFALTRYGGLTAAEASAEVDRVFEQFKPSRVKAKNAITYEEFLKLMLSN